MSQKKVTVSFAVPAGYDPGDYAQLFGNGGSGNVDYNTPLSVDKYPLFPAGKGIHGYGQAPYGNHHYGLGLGTGPRGYGNLPYGNHPYGLGTALIEASVMVDDCGEYKFAIGLFDEAGNFHSGTPEEEAIEIHVAPDKPDEYLVKNSYDKDTDVLVLDITT